MEITHIKIPEYKGSIEIADGFVINILKMPKKVEQEAMNKTFGWKFTTFHNHGNNNSKNRRRI